MKTKNTAFLTIACLALFSSCNIFDKVDDLTDVTFEEELTLTFEVDENESAQNKVYEAVETLDAVQNTTISQYLDKIKEVKVTKVTYTISDFSTEPAGTTVNFSNGKIKFGDVAQTTATVIGTISSLNLSTAAGEHELTLANSDFTTVSSLLLKDKKVKIYTEGTLSKTPVAFKVTTTLHVTIVANPL